jgi:hypothetical protein
VHTRVRAHVWVSEPAAWEPAGAVGPEVHDLPGDTETHSGRWALGRPGAGDVTGPFWVLVPQRQIC